ncbi:hypothetical protein [Bdellovibrio bacteriovorus]|uniref:Uncharacterized protein n=1 Tax=Bdellovibrio bacteriovorus str. Tiberius TaxID=1069642 RepID=K7ZES6_BDEBC|nr:hypothetical protein [Bdellovibrio bacteriovorus]AFY00792.1 Hypothetical protein Bdt_1092 [Bdellovibrio bacteriovorus str. Tiberius]
MKHDSLATILTILLTVLTGCTKANVSKDSKTDSANLNLPSCTNNDLNHTECLTTGSSYVTETLGTDLTGTTATVPVPMGFYDGNSQFTGIAPDLQSSNIKNGVTLFGVSGTFDAAFSACGDNLLNATACTTALNRYVYNSEFGGRSSTCTPGQNTLACWTNSLNQYVTATSGNNINAVAGAISSTIPDGYYDGKVCTMSDADLVSSNIRSGVSIFGTTGNYAGDFQATIASGAHRSPGTVVQPNLESPGTSAQISHKSEMTTYVNSDLPSSAGLAYREVPNVHLDDNGADGVNCKMANRPSINCGTSQNSIALRIADCAAKNPTESLWDGAVQCNGGQGTWKLVTRAGPSQEVWQDERTQLIWGSPLTPSSWCTASGNRQEAPFYRSLSYNGTSTVPIIGNGTISAMSGGESSQNEWVTVAFSDSTHFSVTSDAGGTGCQAGAITSGTLTAVPGSSTTWGRSGYCSFTITQGSTPFASGDTMMLRSTEATTASCLPGSISGLQPSSPLSLCAEATGLSGVAGEDWSMGTYLPEKGRMGKNSVPSIFWRLPTLNDYRLAANNGANFVLPSISYYEMTSTVTSNILFPAASQRYDRSGYWTFTLPNSTASPQLNHTNFSIFARCVGR